MKVWLLSFVKVHESIENRKAIVLIVIQFQIVKVKLCLEREMQV
jgi:hypothetical protein